MHRVEWSGLPFCRLDLSLHSMTDQYFYPERCVEQSLLRERQLAYSMEIYAEIQEALGPTRCLIKHDEPSKYYRPI